MAIHKGKDLGRMGGSCFFQPKKKNFFFPKNQSCPGTNGFPWEEISFPSLERVFKQAGQITRVKFGIFEATLVWDGRKGPWMTFKFPSSLEMFWVHPSPGNSFSFLLGWPSWLPVHLGAQQLPPLV